jgi:hypothetical protein
VWAAPGLLVVSNGVCACLLKLENTEDPSLIGASEPHSGSFGAKGCGVGTRLAYENAGGSPDCEGGQFSLLLETEGGYTELGLFVDKVLAFHLSGECLFALRRGALRSE